MSALSLLKHCYLAYFSKPAAERVLYRAVRGGKVRSIVEIGVGDGQRAARLIRAAALLDSQGGVRYTGIDLFEARPDGLPGLSLKQAHRQLSPLAGKVKLTPGDPFSALARTANSLTDTDLLVIAAGADEQSLSRAWFYVPRMLHANSQVFLQEPAPSSDEARFQLVSREEIERMAMVCQRSRKRAA